MDKKPVRVAPERDLGEVKWVWDREQGNGKTAAGDFFKSTGLL